MVGDVVAVRMGRQQVRDLHFQPLDSGEERLDGAPESTKTAVPPARSATR